MGHVDSLSAEKEGREEKEGNGTFKGVIWATDCVMITFLGLGKLGGGAGLEGDDRVHRKSSFLINKMCLSACLLHGDCREWFG